jgi:predicted enzyme related to lactoylglutathione lyase
MVSMFSLRLDAQVDRVEARHRHADAVGVLIDEFDIVGRVARRIVVVRVEGVEQRAETVEADGGAVKRGKIEMSHMHILLEAMI